MNIKIGKGVVEVIKGDITAQDTVAIVNAANNHLWMGGGVAGAIKRKGGEIIEEEAVAQGPISIGQAVITTGGNLKAKYVIHAAGMGQDLKTDSEKIKMATHNSLLLAEKNTIASIAFPAIGTGVGGFSTESCAHIMVHEAVDFMVNAKNLKTVRFVLFDEPMYLIFKQELEQIFTAKK